MPSGKNAWLTFLTFDLFLIKIVILHALLAVSMTNILLVYLHGGMPHLNHEKALSQMLLGMISSWPNFCIHFGLNLQENKPPLLAEKSWLQQLSRRGKFCMREWMCGMHGMRGLPRPMRGGWQV